MIRIETFAVATCLFAIAACQTVPEPATTPEAPAGAEAVKAAFNCTLAPDVVSGGGAMQPRLSPAVPNGFDFALVQIKEEGAPVTWAFVSDGRAQAVGLPRATIGDQQVIGNWSYRDADAPRVSLVSLFDDGAALVSFLTGSAGHVTHPGSCQEIAR